MIEYHSYNGFTMGCYTNGPKPPKMGRSFRWSLEKKDYPEISVWKMAVMMARESVNMSFRPGVSK